MKMSQDDSIRRILQEKFENYEAPVDGKLWGELQGRVQPNMTAALGSKLVSLVLVIALLSFYSDSNRNTSISGDPVSEVQFVVVEPIKTDGDSQIVERTFQLTSLNRESHGRGEEYSPIQRIESDVLRSEVVESSAEEGAINANFPLKETLSILPKTIFLPTSLVTVSQDAFSGLEVVPLKKSKRITFTLIHGLTMNYLRYQPNTSDTLLFEERTNKVNLSTHRIGFNPRLEIKAPLGKKLMLNSTLSMHFQRYEIDLSYQPFNRFGEDYDVLVFQRKFNTLTGGIGLGLSYFLDHSNNKYLDLNLDYQRVLDGLPNQDVVSFHNNLFNLRFGISYLIPTRKRWSWVIQPYGSYSINQPQTSSPIQLQPYSLGLGLGVNW